LTAVIGFAIKETPIEIIKRTFDREF
jgi:hypothetical protein